MEVAFAVLLAIPDRPERGDRHLVAVPLAPPVGVVEVQAVAQVPGDVLVPGQAHHLVGAAVAVIIVKAEGVLPARDEEVGLEIEEIRVDVGLAAVEIAFPLGDRLVVLVIALVGQAVVVTDILRPVSRVRPAVVQERLPGVVPEFQVVVPAVPPLGRCRS